ncbi:MAG: hypothetical protein QMD13_09425 [Candidatus Bathyarchaeia archaeon]|nr:hypothetical protein [Candidatus Bathyarchaeia archaeon]
MKALTKQLERQILRLYGFWKLWQAGKCKKCIENCLDCNCLDCYVPKKGAAVYELVRFAEDICEEKEVKKHERNKKRKA